MKERLNILVGMSIVVILFALLIHHQFQERKEKAFVFESHPAIEHPDVPGKKIVKRIELSKPIKAFNFKLIDMDNRITQLNDFRGKLVLVGFIYTSCPDVCGLLTQHFRYVQRQFKGIIEKDLVLIFITTDPKRDTPERVKAYTEGFGGKWHFLTGTESDLQEVWNHYKVFVKPKESVDIVYHSYMVTLIDRYQNVRYRYVGLVDPEEIIVSDIKKLLKQGGV